MDDCGGNNELDAAEGPEAGAVGRGAFLTISLYMGGATLSSL